MFNKLGFLLFAALISTVGYLAGFSQMFPLAVFFILLLLRRFDYLLEKMLSGPEWFAGLPSFVKLTLNKLSRNKNKTNRSEKILRATFYGLSSLILIHLLLLLISFLTGNRIEDDFNLSSVTIFAIIYSLIFLGARYENRTLQFKKELTQEDNIYQGWLRASVFITVCSIILVFINYFINYYEAFHLDIAFYFYDLCFFILLIVLLLMCVDFMLFLAKKIIKNYVAGQQQLKIDDNFYLLQAFFGCSGFKASLKTFFQNLLGIDFENSEIIRFFSSIFEPVLIFSLLLVWLATSIVIVPPTKTGLFFSFGEILSKKGSSPGIYLKLPWPFGSCQLHDKNRVRLMNIGFEPVENTNHIVWARSHARKNFNLVIGDGLEMISIDCQIMYRLKNVRSYQLSFSNAEELLSALAYKYLTRASVGESFDSIIMRDRQKMAESLQKNIQKDLDTKNTGIEILDMVFLAMHPPLEVASAYEDVISAQIVKSTLRLMAETEAIHKTYMNKAFSRDEVFAAESEALTKIAESTGQAQAFVSNALGFNYSPEIARFRLKLESLEKLLKGKKLYLLDKTLLRKSDKLMLRLTR
ncbi:MAG: SPFH domain-containing protein [Candidatus Rifleibacteriota bacterium]